MLLILRSAIQATEDDTQEQLTEALAAQGNAEVDCQQIQKALAAKCQELENSESICERQQKCAHIPHITDVCTRLTTFAHHEEMI